MTIEEKINLKAEFFELCQDILIKTAKEKDIEKITTAMCNADMQKIMMNEFLGV